MRVSNPHSELVPDYDDIVIGVMYKCVNFSQLELWKEFAEEAHSVALHPSGLYMLVGFSDKLRLMNILIDDIRTFKEITIRGCKEVHYTNTLPSQLPPSPPLP